MRECSEPNGKYESSVDTVDSLRISSSMNERTLRKSPRPTPRMMIIAQCKSPRFEAPDTRCPSWFDPVVGDV